MNHMTTKTLQSSDGLPKCPICFKDISNPKNRVDLHPRQSLPHFLHQKCLEALLKANQGQGRIPCPLCRRNIEVLLATPETEREVIKAACLGNLLGVFGVDHILKCGHGLHDLLEVRRLLTPGYDENDLLAAGRLLCGHRILSRNARGVAVRESAQRGHTDIVSRLLRDGTISKLDRSIAFLEAAKNGHVAIVNCLLAEGVTIQDKFRDYAVIAAAINGHVGTINRLLADGAVISETARGEAVETAASNGYLNIVECLLADGAVIPEFARNDAVEAAAFHGHLNVVERLLADGAVIPEFARV